MGSELKDDNDSIGNRHEVVDITEGMLARARNLKVAPKIRSGILHELMDMAKAAEDNTLWDRTGQAIVDSYRDRDDISAKVSDHFVRDCPNEIFKKYALLGPHDPYIRWYKRAKKFYPEHFANRKSKKSKHPR